MAMRQACEPLAPLGLLMINVLTQQQSVCADSVKVVLYCDASLIALRIAVPVGGA
jgi:hypothetical protein